MYVAASTNSRVKDAPARHRPEAIERQAAFVEELQQLDASDGAFVDTARLVHRNEPEPREAIHECGIDTRPSGDRHGLQLAHSPKPSRSRHWAMSVRPGRVPRPTVG